MKRQERAQQMPVIVPVWCVGAFCFFLICVSVMYWAEQQPAPGDAETLDPPEIVQPRESKKLLRESALDAAIRRAAEAEAEAEERHADDDLEPLNHETYEEPKQ